jgi:hypothetical protein
MDAPWRVHVRFDAIQDERAAEHDEIFCRVIEPALKILSWSG